MATAEETLLGPDFLKRLDRLDFRIRRLEAGLQRGDVATLKKGAGTIFRDHRPYGSGDDLRFLDWNAYMRWGQLHIKQFQAEERPRILLMVDQSASMGLGDQAKWRTAASLAACVGCLGLLRHAVVDWHPYPTGPTKRFQSRGHIPRLLRTITGTKPEGASHFLRAAQHAAPSNTTSGLAFVFSDWLDTQAQVEGLRWLRHRGFRTQAVRISDPVDRSLRPGERVHIRDVETGRWRRERLDRAIVADYLKALDEHFAAVERACLRLRVSFGVVPTSESTEAATARILKESPWCR